jgi:hypothetical protein
LDTILNVNFCLKELKITNQNKNERSGSVTPFYLIIGMSVPMFHVHFLCFVHVLAAIKKVGDEVTDF